MIFFLFDRFEKIEYNGRLFTLSLGLKGDWMVVVAVLGRGIERNFILIIFEYFRLVV